MHFHAKDPEAPAPSTIEDLQHELEQLGADLHDASHLAHILFEYQPEKVQGAVSMVEGLARRSYERVQEAADALSSGHTENVGFRMDDVIMPVRQAHGVAQQAWDVRETHEVSEQQSQSFSALTNALHYVYERLEYLVYEADLPID